MTSNTNDELFKLCKETYEKTGWDGALRVFTKNVASGNTVQFDSHSKAPVTYPYDQTIYPIYTSDYLLEKLEGFGYMDGPSKGIELKTHNNHGWGWLAYIPEYAYKYGGDENIGFADTPLEALLKLTIALHETGDLS